MTAKKEKTDWTYICYLETGSEDENVALLDVEVSSQLLQNSMSCKAASVPTTNTSIDIRPMIFVWCLSDLN